MEVVGVIKSPNELHSDCIVYYEDPAILQERYPTRYRSEEEIKADKARHKGAVIRASIERKWGWW